MAAGGVAEVNQVFEGVGGVDVVSGCASGSGVAKGVLRLRAFGRSAQEDRSTFFGHAGRAAHHVLGLEAFEEGLLLSGEEAHLEPAEDVIHDGLGEADVGIMAPAAGLEAGVGELFAEQLEGDAVLQREGDAASEAVHEAADGAAFLGHGDEQFAGHAVLVEADGDVAFVASDVELVGDGEALVGEAMTDGARRSVSIVGFDGSGSGFDLLQAVGRVRTFGVERLRTLGAVAIDGDRFEAELPGLDVGLHDVVNGGVLGKIDGLGDGAGDEGLSGGHHLDVSHVRDGAGALGGLERAIEDGEMFLFDVRRAFDGAGSVNVADDGVGLVAGVAELEECGGHCIVHDLDHAAAN